MTPTDITRCGDWAGSCEYGPHCLRTAPIAEGQVAPHGAFNAHRLALGLNADRCLHLLRNETTYCEAEE
jgi:hypothetical protein